MNEDIVDELREVSRVFHREITAVLGAAQTHELETSIPWRGANEIASLRLSLKEAEASRAKIIEECAWLLELNGHPVSAGLVRTLHDGAPATSARDEIIEECAKVADVHAKEMWGHTEEEAAAEEIAKAIRALKGKPNG